MWLHLSLTLMGTKSAGIDQLSEGGQPELEDPWAEEEEDVPQAES